MRFNKLILFLLPALAVAQEKTLFEHVDDWIETAKTYSPITIKPKVPVVPGVERVPAKNVVHLTAKNWVDVLQPSTSARSAKGPDNWMVLVSGGNKTCYGQCDPLEKEWTKAAATFAADPKAPHLGFLDCETSGLVCSTWFAGPASLWYIQLPVPDASQSKPATTIHVVKLNTTSITAQELVAIHREKTYLKEPALDSIFHPFDGFLVQNKLNTAVGFALYEFSLIPSWIFMLVVSFASRTIINRSVSKRPGLGATAPRQAPTTSQPKGGAPAAKAK